MKESKVSKVLLNITSVFCFIYFALYTFSLVFIPIGIYCYIAGKRFNYKADHLEDTMFIRKETFRNYVIFVSIFCFPFGLLSIIPYILLVSNRVKVSDAKQTKIEVVKESVNDEVQKNNKTQEENIATESKISETESEKLEKFKKLQNFKEKGLITEEELEQAREQLFGKKED